MYCSRGRFIFLIPFVVTATLAWAAHCDAQMSLEVLKRDGYTIVPIARPEPNSLVVRGKVDGRQVSLVIDTGAGSRGIILDVNGAGGSAEARSITGQKLNFKQSVAKSFVLGGAEFKDVPYDLGSMRGLRRLGVTTPTGSHIFHLSAGDGLIGAGFLHTAAAIIDLPNLRLYVRPPGVGRRVVIGEALKQIGFAEVPFVVASNACYVKVSVNRVEAIMQIDTGAAGGLIDPRFMAAAKVGSYGSKMKLLDVAGAEQSVKLSHIADFKIGEIAPLRMNEVVVGSCAQYGASGGKVVGLMGIDILGPNGSIIDFAQQKLYFFKAR